MFGLVYHCYLYVFAYTIPLEHHYADRLLRNMYPICTLAQMLCGYWGFVSIPQRSCRDGFTGDLEVMTSRTTSIHGHSSL